MAETSKWVSGVRYWVTRTVTINHVKAKIEANRDVTMDSFFCPNDPNRVKFTLRICFAKHFNQSGRFSVDVFPVEENVLATYFKATLFNKKGECFATEIAEGESAWYGGPMAVESGSSGGNLPVEYPESPSNTWYLVVDFEYTAPSFNPDPYNRDPKPNSGLAKPAELKEGKGSKLKEFRLLLDSEEDADVKFLVGGETIMAHKLILTTRCSYFKSMFDSGMTECASREIEVTDMKPAVLRELLKYVYTDDLPEYQSITFPDLYCAADKFGLEVLKKAVEFAIYENLNPENVVEALLLAESYDREELMNRATSEFKSCSDSLSNEKWDKLEKNPKLLRKLFQPNFSLKTATANI